MQDLHALRLSSFLVASVRASTDIDCIVLPDIHIVSMLVLLIIELYIYIYTYMPPCVLVRGHTHTHTRSGKAYLIRSPFCLHFGRCSESDPGDHHRRRATGLEAAPKPGSRARVTAEKAVAQFMASVVFCTTGIVRFGAHALSLATRHRVLIRKSRHPLLRSMPWAPTAQFIFASLPTAPRPSTIAYGNAIVSFPWLQPTKAGAVPAPTAGLGFLNACPS